jgi:hypothetical protein
MIRRLARSSGLALFTVLAHIALVGAQAAPASIGSAQVPRKVMAGGQPLAAGTYTVRLSNDPVKPVVGQSPDGSRWVEFVQGGAVKGRELATVLTAADLKVVLDKGEAPPAPGSSRVEMLKGGEYLRLWFNQAGTHYLIHLAVAK